MATSIVELFLSTILGFLYKKDAANLQNWLRVEPPLPQQYFELARELQQSYKDSNVLERSVDRLMPERQNPKFDEGNVWPGFLAFVKAYLEFWRDVNFNNLLETHIQLTTLVSACISAFSNASYGILLLPTTMQLCTSLTKLAMTLDKRPDLTRKLRNLADAEGGEGKKTLVESTAETIQRAFIMCLSERSANNGIGKDGRAEGKKAGIYKFANLVLKLFFQCRKTRLARQYFTNISQLSPPLSLYPASQRVTYLYYLGRFQFSNNHFYHAQSCLQAAYDQCHARCINQRRLILIYLLATNLILGRFASKAFLSRPESSGIIEKFIPISKAIRRGDIAAFKRALGPESGNEQWFFHKGLLLVLLSRAEVLVWRSLARRVFLITYQLPSDPNSRKAPTLDLHHVVIAAQYCQKILEGWSRPSSLIDPLSGTFPDLIPPQNGPQKLQPNQGVVLGNLMPDILEIEALTASLVQQGLLHGFVSHNLGRFAILGAKQRGGALVAGFPAPWAVLTDRFESSGEREDVPGWVMEDKRAGMLGGVVNLTGLARPVGSGL